MCFFLSGRTKKKQYVRIFYLTPKPRQSAGDECFFLLFSPPSLKITSLITCFLFFLTLLLHTVHIIHMCALAANTHPFLSNLLPHRGAEVISPDLHQHRWPRPRDQVSHKHTLPAVNSEKLPMPSHACTLFLYHRQSLLFPCKSC